MKSADYFAVILLTEWHWSHNLHFGGGNNNYYMIIYKAPELLQDGMW